MEQKDDLPKSVIVILVVLAVAISVLGMVAVLTELNTINAAPVHKGSPTAQGKIRLYVEDPNAQNNMPQVTGQIVLFVENPEV